MTAAVKTVLFVDYDSLYLSLRARDPGMARRFASRPGAWIEAIESGQLITPVGDTPVRRRILMRRCYADPKLLGKARPAFASQGFQIVDCPPLPGRDRNSAEIQMVLDTVDALGHQTGFDEFILLSADTDLTPVIFRLRSYNRSTTIYSSAMTPAGYRAIADGTIEEAALIAVLGPTADAEPPETDEPDEDAPAGRPAGERDDLASLARRIHQATSVPLFTPKVFAELFRALSHEITENGYHFQTTAENVAVRLVAAGRSATRRQVAFVVKGLALKGHVFSVTDTPERLAEVFKEQVLYLARNAGIEVDDAVEMQVKAWISGRANTAEVPALPPPAAVAPPVTAPAIPMPPPQPQRPAAPTSTAKLTPIPSPPPMPAAPESPAKPRPIILRGTEQPLPQPIRPISVRPAAPAPEAPAPAVAAPRHEVERRAPQPVAPRPQPQPPAAANADEPVPAPRAAPAPRPTAQPPILEAEEPVRPRTPIGPPRPRIARSPNPPEVAPPSPPVPASPAPARSAVATVRPPARRTAPPTAEAVDRSDKDPIETSILAAIAEAVDVLVVEEGEANTSAPASNQLSPEKAVPQAPEAAADDGDIGDEIQRILAAYSQNRKPSGK
ncbi:hypothetical protein C3941_24360 [Kaistia algarum]|uniref:NYN domain-containing protein n=1 Tax=Kaistia algarum TaxID=2083279 RepID=UPI000CE8E5D9|nr:NYN domain-containing protein [Kaistia algarum]MCX5514117.1 NYN domain-containing protein [Kaistia algarum]PPE77314.1 hypothetical protein C3941_24360 [Kaistia algarum]